MTMSTDSDLQVAKTEPRPLPRSLAEVDDEESAGMWFWSIARNFDAALISQIQTGTIPQDEVAASPKIASAVDAWNRYLSFTQGVFISLEGELHLPS